MLVRRGGLSEAISEYRRALEIPPEDAAGHVRLAALLLETGSDDLATAHYRRASEIAPDSVAILNALAWTLATSNRLDCRNGVEAIAHAEKANQRTAGRNPLVLRTLAASYAEARRLSDAIVTAERALKLTDDCSLAELLGRDINTYRAEMYAAASGRTAEPTVAVPR
jgi:tetratricopeptide (TPR) repeat protein